MIFKQIYLAHSRDPERYSHLRSEWTREEWQWTPHSQKTQNQSLTTKRMNTNVSLFAVRFRIFFYYLLITTNKSSWKIGNVSCFLYYQTLGFFCLFFNSIFLWLPFNIFLVFLFTKTVNSFRISFILLIMPSIHHWTNFSLRLQNRRSVRAINKK